MAFTLSTEYEALKHDVTTLFSRFYQKQSVRFEDFVTEWKAMNFGCIFAATYRNTVSAKMRIVERLFRVASEFLSQDSTLLYRVAAMYMFYAVYFRQICEYKVKIRMTPAMWKDLKDLYDILIEHQHLDVAYIFQVLRLNNAFVFTAFPKYLLFGRHEFMLGIEGMSNLRHTYEADRYVNDLISTNDVMESLHRIQADYEEVKKKVLQESKEDEREYLSKVLYYSNSDFPQELQQMIETHKSKHKAGAIHKPTELLDDIQRPVLSKLQELNEMGKVETVKHSGSNRMDVISKIKEASWKTAVSSSSSFASKLSRATASEDNDESEDDFSSIVYRKSAMLQPLKQKRNKRTLGSRSIRYKKASDQ